MTAPDDDGQVVNVLLGAHAVTYYPAGDDPGNTTGVAVPVPVPDQGGDQS